MTLNEKCWNVVTILYCFLVAVQVRSACAFLLHVCEDEAQLFFQFFTCPSPILKFAQLSKQCTYYFVQKYSYYMYSTYS